MTVLEQVTQMKAKGMSDEEIIAKLREQGASPKEINDAFSQAQIKSAVSKDQEEMHPSIMNQPPSPPTPKDQGRYAPKTQEIPESQNIKEEELYIPPQEYPSSEEFYEPNVYDNYSAAGISTDTIIEISEQVFSEKIKAIKKQLEDINEFKTLAQTKIDNIAGRLKRIEATIDKLQLAILEKIGSYGKGLDTIKKEMSMMQDSFGKIINPLIDKTEKTHATKKTTPLVKRTSIAESRTKKSDLHKTHTKKISKKKTN